MGTKFDYDLNIYRLEEENEDGVYEYTDQWYVDIYEYVNKDGYSDQVHVKGPFSLVPEQAMVLQLGKDGTYFEGDDSWYGLEGFEDVYQDRILPDLKKILDSLPKYKEELLF